MLFFDNKSKESSSEDDSSSSLGDWHFHMIPCNSCKVEVIGKSMEICGDCNQKYCQDCDMHFVGCAHDDSAFICNICFSNNHQRKKKYCPEPLCDCQNKSPRFMLSKRRKYHRRMYFNTHFDAEKWKETHVPINYPSVHKGKYLVDVMKSNDDFDYGYIDWLIRTGSDCNAQKQYTAEQNANFQKFVAEAKELKKISENMKIHTYNLRGKRDASPKRN